MPSTSNAPATAAELVDRAPAVANPFTFPDQLGAGEGDLLLADRTQLGAILRHSQPVQPTLTNEHGWWTLRLADVGLRAEGEGFDELAVNAVNALRGRVADLDPTGESGDPLVWLVLSSTDVELRAWLHIPLEVKSAR